MRIAFAFLIIFFIRTDAFSQQQNEAFIDGSEKNIASYFESNHLKNYKNEFSSVNHSYQAYASFVIDKKGSIINLEVIDFPGARLPENVTNYLKGLILSSDKNWQPATINNNPVMSDTIVLFFSVINKQQTITDRMKDLQAYSEYTLQFEPNIKKEEKLDRVIYKKQYTVLLPFNQGIQ